MFTHSSSLRPGIPSPASIRRTSVGDPLTRVSRATRERSAPYNLHASLRFLLSAAQNCSPNFRNEISDGHGVYSRRKKERKKEREVK